ncbi:Pro-neuregulin-3, membrane-bound isoform [Channa argus]|uniref:Pro-neuregulin-3, membrane-bound isoform n=1 Tax=Channa argus TaxID=215402 RepID=A0A6G1R0S7_CHAAH|nr:Pro-neuregulin-3, membrane-bound isoform [Channa argus]
MVTQNTLQHEKVDILNYKEVTLNQSPASPTVPPLHSEHFKPCHEKDLAYCLNGGECFVIETLSGPHKHCNIMLNKENVNGVRMEEVDLDFGQIYNVQSWFGCLLLCLRAAELLDSGGSSRLKYKVKVLLRCREGYQGIRCDQFLPKTDSILSDPTVTILIALTICRMSDGNSC